MTAPARSAGRSRSVRRGAHSCRRTHSRPPRALFFYAPGNVNRGTIGPRDGRSSDQPAPDFHESRTCGRASQTEAELVFGNFELRAGRQPRALAQRGRNDHAASLVNGSSHGTRIPFLHATPELLISCSKSREEPPACSRSSLPPESKTATRPSCCPTAGRSASTRWKSAATTNGG